ncbi:MAG TPA: hypothetical protein VKT27_02685 [Candidatus Binataceae bacterium]|nr:hypothetical protein [Candidatus Binataceae bacterium]
MAAASSYGVAGVGRFLHREFVAAWPVFLFFLVGFLLLACLIKLTLAGFSIQISALSNAVVGAAIAAKAALLMDETPLARKLSRHRRIVAIAVKTLFYGVVSLLLGYVERFLDAARRVHSVVGGVRYLIAHADHHRLFAWALGIAIVFALYFLFLEISQQMGEGALWRLFFEAPRDASGADATSRPR